MALILEVERSSFTEVISSTTLLLGDNLSIFVWPKCPMTVPFRLVTVPEVGDKFPARIFKSVDFPFPFFPIIPIRSFLLIIKDRLFISDILGGF
jgi:hypothetical protein